MKVLRVLRVLLMVAVVLVGVTPAILAANEAVPVVRAGGAVNINGSLDEWAGAGPIVLTSPMVAHATDVKDNGDLSGVGYLMWDDKYLYVGVKVIDDTLIFERTGGDIWQTDCVEVWINGFQFGLTIDANGEAYAHGWQGSVPGIELAVKTREDLGQDPDLKVLGTSGGGYVVEAAFPIAELGSLTGMTPQAGSTFQFSLGIDDADDEGGSRLGQLYFPVGWVWGNSSSFATAYLLK